MNKPLNSKTPAMGGRALVLGGGGSTGNAWEIGVIAGMFDTGLDVTTADLIVGTSAGSTTAAQITGADPDKLFTVALTATPQQHTGTLRPQRAHTPVRPSTDQIEKISKIIATSLDATDMRRKIGAAAIHMSSESDGSWQAQWRATVALRLPKQHWPLQTVLITAVNAHTGEPVVFDSQSGIELTDAVAASCSSGLPYKIRGNLYIDGGYRSNADNADLAAGYSRVLVLSPFGGQALHPVEWGMHLATQVDELRAGGSRVETIFPDSESEHMFGANAMNPSLRAPAAQAGYNQGKALAQRLTDFWS